MARHRLARVAIATRRLHIEELRASDSPPTVDVGWERAWSRGLWGVFLPERRMSPRAPDHQPPAEPNR